MSSGMKLYLFLVLGGRNWQRTCPSLEIIFLNKFFLAVWPCFKFCFLIWVDSSFSLTSVVVSQDPAYPLLLLVLTKPREVKSEHDINIASVTLSIAWDQHQVTIELP